MSDLLLEYTNLLHEHQNPDAPAVRAFVAQHAGKDPEFLNRVKKLNALLTLKLALAPSSSARMVLFRSGADLGLAAADDDSVELANVEEGYRLRISKAGELDRSSLQFEGAVPATDIQLFVGDTPVELVQPLNQYGHAQVKTDDIRPVLRGQAELRVRVE